MKKETILITSPFAFIDTRMTNRCNIQNVDMDFMHACILALKQTSRDVYYSAQILLWWSTFKHGTS